MHEIKYPTLELITRKHAFSLWEAIDRNRSHLSQFLPWVDHMQSIEQVKTISINVKYLTLREQK